MSTTKLYAPAYYRDFVCIADRCRHTCCVGWEIDVDSDTYKIYKSLAAEYGTRIRDSIDTASDPDTPHFRLCEGDRCPHLDERGLCRIITELGEGYLCEICREHPRFYHDTPRGKEVGLGMACEEACRIILGSDNYAEFEEIEALDALPYEPDGDFDATAHRAALYAILSDRSLPYPERLRRIEDTYRVTPAALPDGAWQDTLAALEYLGDGHRAILVHYTSEPPRPTKDEPALERALAYFIYRHASPTEDEREFRAAVGFSLLCERLLASIVPYAKGGIHEAARIVSEELEYSEDNTESLLDVFRECAE